MGDIFERYPPKEEIPSLEESLSKKAILIQEPGLSFSYSNTGYNLLDLLIEEVTGRDFAEYMKEEVLIPLGMHNSSFTWSEEFDPAVPVGYDLKGNPVPVYIYPEKASDGLFANVEDIAAFAAAGMTNFSHTDHQVLNDQSINKLYTPMVEKIGIYGVVLKRYRFSVLPFWLICFNPCSHYRKGKTNKSIGTKNNLVINPYRVDLPLALFSLQNILPNK